MVNRIKQSADGLALQVTKEARKAGLVQEDGDGNPIDLADVAVWAFDDLLIVVGMSVDMGERAGLVSAAAGDTDSIHAGRQSTLAVAGNGYQVQLPGAKAAGFPKGTKPDIRAVDGVLFIHGATNDRLVDDLATIRE